MATIIVGDLQSIGVLGWWQTDQSGGTLPGTVGSVTASAQSASSILVSWGYVSGATGYDVYYSTSPTTGFALVPVANGDGANVQDISLLVTGLSAGTTYYFKVKAKNASGDSASFSSVASAKTSDPSTASLSTLSTTALASVVEISGTVSIMNNESGEIFDLIIDDDVISLVEATWYYNDVVENSGGAAIPRCS